jgi:hypothetical protein
MILDPKVTWATADVQDLLNLKLKDLIEDPPLQPDSVRAEMVMQVGARIEIG